MKNFVWLASYPKSGNTWTRAFLANFLADGDAPLNINELHTDYIASARPPFDVALGYDSANLSHSEIDVLRREWYFSRARTADHLLFSKVHDAYTYLPNGDPIFPPEVTKAVLYIVRNPLDVCVSYAHHLGHTGYDRAIEILRRPRHTVCGQQRRLHDQLRQRMLSWGEHVASWTNAPDQQVLVVPYEKLKRDPEGMFRRVVQFVGLPDDPARIEKAIRFSRFEELKKQEAQNGFKERTRPDRAFFRQGRSGSWRDTLSPAQAEELVRDHRETMFRLGYLSDDGQVLC